MLKRPGVSELHLVEAEADALACARRNVADPRAAFHWADATRFHPGRAMDFVVMNPPFHGGRAADPALGAAFIRQAAAILQPAGGCSWSPTAACPMTRCCAQRSHVSELAA